MKTPRKIEDPQKTLVQFLLEAATCPHCKYYPNGHAEWCPFVHGNDGSAAFEMMVEGRTAYRAFRQLESSPKRLQKKTSATNPNLHPRRKQLESWVLERERKKKK